MGFFLLARGVGMGGGGDAIKPVITELSLTATPGKRHTFLAKGVAVAVDFIGRGLMRSITRGIKR